MGVLGGGVVVEKKEVERYRFPQAFFDLTEARNEAAEKRVYGRVSECAVGRYWRLPLDTTPSYLSFPLALQALSLHSHPSAILFSLRRAASRWLSHIRHERLNTNIGAVHGWVVKANNSIADSQHLVEALDALQQLKGGGAEEDVQAVKKAVALWMQLGKDTYGPQPRENTKRYNEHATRGYYAAQLLQAVSHIPPTRLILLSFEQYSEQRCEVAREIAKALCLNNADLPNPNPQPSTTPTSTSTTPDPFLHPSHPSSAHNPFSWQPVCGGFHRDALVSHPGSHSGTHGSQDFKDETQDDVALRQVHEAFQPLDRAVPLVLAALQKLGATVIPYQEK